MKKKYLIISLLIIFLLTGCNVKYSLKIQDGVVKESFKITEKSSSNNLTKKDEFGYSFYEYAKKYGEEDDIDTQFEDFYSPTDCVSDCSFYDKKFIDKDGIIGFELSHEFKIEDYSSSSIAREMIPSFSSNYDGRYLTISGGPSGGYFNDYDSIDSVEVSIETNYKVISTNLKSTKDGVYQKTITKNDKNLFITMDTDIVYNYVEEDNNFMPFLIAFLAILIIALLVCAFNGRKKYR